MSEEVKAPESTVPAPKEPYSIKSLMSREDVLKRLESVLGKRASTFATSVVQIVNQSSQLQKCDPVSIMNSAMVAATLDLPVNAQLGFAWVVPYGQQAQFQIGWKGLVQLAQRTGQYLKINVVEVYEPQFKSWDALSETLDADFSEAETGVVVGYCAYFKMLNGFEKVVYWTSEKVQKHAQKYSKSYKNGPWQSEFDKMAKKTVLKNMLSQWGYLSVEMQQAIRVDQSVIKDESAESIEYVDAYNDIPVEITKEEDNLDTLIQMIANAKTLTALNKIKTGTGDDLFEKVKDKWEERREQLGAEADKESNK